MSLQDTYFPSPTYGLPTVWKNKTVLVMTKQAQLPDRCVKCNAPTQNRLQRSLRWHHPALYIVIAGGVLLYVILALVLSKTATINVGLCETHAAARKRDILITWALVVLSIVCMILSAMMEELSIFFIGLLLFFGAVIYGVLKARVVVPQKIDDQYVYLIGVNPDYLQQFPDWQPGTVQGGYLR